MICQYMFGTTARKTEHVCVGGVEGAFRADSLIMFFFTLQDTEEGALLQTVPKQDIDSDDTIADDHAGGAIAAAASAATEAAPIRVVPVVASESWPRYAAPVCLDWCTHTRD